MTSLVNDDFKDNKAQNNTDDLATELRNTINSSLINVGVLAALMMALAGAIYVDAPEEGLCYGDVLLRVEMVTVWMAMGCFFFATIGALVLHLDVEGVPTKMLLKHTANGSEIIYCLPHIATAIGIILTAVAYGIDIGERGGCPFLIFGLIAAPMFVLAIVALWLYCRKRRQRLYQKQDGDRAANDGNTFDASLFATWADRVTVAGVS